MKGPHDDKLAQSGHWPLRGTFTIELLNQLSENYHYSPSVVDVTGRSINRVTGNEMVAIESMMKFISHDTLSQHNGYLKNDSLHFRISYIANDDDGTK